MEKCELKNGMVVQLNPETVRNKMFAACMMIISAPKDFGAQGFVQSLGSGGEPGGQAYYRANWDEMEFVGNAVWNIER